MIPNTLRMAVAGMAVSLSGASAMAQWSVDPLAPLKVADGNGDQTQAKIGGTPDGGCYLSWFDNTRVNYKSDTWVWNGASWARLAATGPAARVRHAMAFDAATGRTVLFGGSNAAGLALSDTWEFDGTAWSQSIASGPASRERLSLGYDAAHATVILFGGLSGTGALLGDTWAYDGSAWSIRFPATSPSARQDASLAYDPVRNTLVLFGGEDATGKLSDTWEWNGSTWTLVSTPSAPGARSSAAFSYDPVTARMVLMGGSDSGNSALQDTWSYDGSTWTSVTTTTSPNSRYGAAMTYGPHTGTANTNTVATLSPTVGVCGQQVTVSYNSTGRPLSAANPVFMHYGFNNWSTVNPTDATMVFNAGVSRWQATITLPAGNVSQLDVNFNNGAGTQDTNSNNDWHYETTWPRALVYGGFSGSFNVSGHSEFIGNTWSNKFPSPAPSARAYPAAVYDSTRNVDVLFGGVDLGGYDVQLQRLNAAGYEQWPHNGVQLTDRGVSSTTDYDMIVDAAGNAIVGYNDDSVPPGIQQISVVKVDPSGQILWKSVVSTDTIAKSNAHIAQLSDGSYAVAWSYTGVTGSQPSLQMQRLDTDGNPLWAVGGLALSEATHYMAPSDIKPSGTGFVLMWVRGQTNSLSNKGLRVQKFDAGGAPQWTGTQAGATAVTGAGTPPVVYLGSNVAPATSIQNGYFPTMAADGSGGVVVGWYENTNPRSAYIQHVLSDGTFKFAAPVSNAVTAASRIRVGAGLAYNTTTGEYYLASPETDSSTQSQNSTFVQKFDSTGARLWGDTGVTIIPISSASQQSFVQCQVVSDGCDVLFMDTRSATTRVIDAARVTGAGAIAWHNLINSDSSTDKGRLISATTGGAGAVIAAYNVGSAGGTDIAANRVNADGTQGSPPCYANCDGSTASPILNVQDFTCFLQRFAAAAPYANCDGSTASPILNVQDFTCFLQKFAAGCN